MAAITVMGSLSAQYVDFPQDAPQGPVSEPEPDSNKTSEPRDMKNVAYVVIGLLVLVLVYFVFFSGGPSADEENRETNRLCDSGENCETHPDECPCLGTTVCDPENVAANLRGCVKENATGDSSGSGDTSGGDSGDSSSSGDTAGNYKCDSGENCWDNPLECKCSSDEYCSESEKACVTPICGNGKCEEIETPDDCCVDCYCIESLQFCNETTNACENYTMSMSCESAKTHATEFFTGQGYVVESLECIGVLSHSGELVYEVEVMLEDSGWSTYVAVRESGEVSELSTS